MIYIWVKKYEANYMKSLYWEWDNGGDDVTLPRKRINTDDIDFPKHFLFGVATSAHQVRKRTHTHKIISHTIDLSALN